MKYKSINLHDSFQNLDGDDYTTYVECFLNDSLESLTGEPGLYPCIVICPGGGYSHVSSREGAPIAMHFVPDGYQVFVVHYSAAPHCFPQQLREVAATLEIINAHAQEWSCDMNNITIMGFSAGGHLAAQYSNRYDCPEIRKTFPDSKPVHQTVLCYPVITSDSDYCHRGSIENFVGHKMYDDDGCHLCSMQEKGCSCEYLVSANTPPTFIWHTVEDQVVPVENSFIYAQALSHNQVPFELHIYPYGSHGLATADDMTNPKLSERVSHCHAWIDDCKRWLRLYS